MDNYGLRQGSWIKSACVGILFVLFLLYSIYAAILLPSDPRIIQQRWPQPRSQHLGRNITTTTPIPSDFINATSVTTTAATPEEPVQNCSAWKSLVFIKSHKTGSTTLQTIVNRFGYFHNLSFVFNRRSSYNGHFYFIPVTIKSPQTYFLPPLGVRVGDYKKYKDYDMLAVHVRYNRTAMDKFMRKDTKYISIIREPSAQWESAFTQFIFEEVFDNSSAIPKEKWIETFLERPSFYREKFRFMKYENVMGRRYYYAQNSQMYDLGLDTGHSFYNETMINETISSIDREFESILIMEYFDESLLILKKELCWEYEDIVYFPKNMRASHVNLTEDVRQRIRDFNHADVLLYDYFNKTLWRKVKEYGPRFDEDLKYFKELNQHIAKDCGNDKESVGKRGKRIFKYKEFSPKKNATFFCRTVAEHKRALFQRVYERQNPYKKPPKKTSLKQTSTKARAKPVTSKRTTPDTKKTIGQVNSDTAKTREIVDAINAQATRLLQARNAKLNQNQKPVTGGKLGDVS